MHILFVNYFSFWFKFYLCRLLLCDQIFFLVEFKNHLHIWINFKLDLPIPFDFQNKTLNIFFSMFTSQLIKFDYSEASKHINRLQIGTPCHGHLVACIVWTFSVNTKNVLDPVPLDKKKMFGRRIQRRRRYYVIYNTQFFKTYSLINQ